MASPRAAHRPPAGAPPPGPLRHLASILVLPGTVVVLVPALLLAYGQAHDTRWTGGGWWLLPVRILSSLLGIAGLCLVTATVRLFARVGQGTLAPWDATRRLVVDGPYRFVRNPMICGVLMLLTAIGLRPGSGLVLGWAALFWLLNTLYFVVSEEPGLRRRFGEDYVRYASQVRRWIPRLRGWDPPTDSAKDVATGQGVGRAGDDEDVGGDE